MAIISKNLSEVYIIDTVNQNTPGVRGIIRIPADNVSGLEQKIKELLGDQTFAGSLIISTDQITGLDTYIFSVNQVNGLDQKLEEAKTEWIII